MVRHSTARMRRAALPGAKPALEPKPGAKPALEPKPGGRAGDAGQAAHDLDRLIHERLRLGIVSALATRESISFNDLKAALKTTDGNLSVHARRLEEAGYVACHKGFEGRLPRTTFRLTPAGRRALERYLAHMEALIKAARG